MNKVDIQGREELSRLIVKFYARVRKDDLLGPIFNSIIQDWDHHMGHITDFWERNLFGTVQFFGNPGRKHMEVDEKQNNTIDKRHFETWLRIFHATVDEMHEGEKAEEIKHKATNIGANFLRMIQNNRARKFANPSKFNKSGFQHGFSVDSE